MVWKSLQAYVLHLSSFFNFKEKLSQLSAIVVFNCQLAEFSVSINTCFFLGKKSNTSPYLWF